MKMLIALTLVSCIGLKTFAQNSNDCKLGVSLNSSYSKAKALDSIIDHYTNNGLPGVALAVYTEREGWWASASGFSRKESNTMMENCHLQYLQSISKTYMAVAILQLHEQGKIILDSPITKYLPARYIRYLKEATRITVRNLLNQNSGLPEYNNDPGFVGQVMEHPLEYFTADDCLKYISGRELLFAPGTKYMYTNTNYLLLSLIADAITKDHAAFIRKNIFEPLALHNTYYDTSHSYLQGKNLPDSYWDVFNTGNLPNISRFQEATVVSSKGDDGVVCTPVDAIRFFKGLMEGKLLKPKSMEMMLDFIKDDKGNFRYGMGITYFDFGGIIAYGHGGGGIGAGCGLVYYPPQKLYLFFATNLGVLVENDLVKKADEMKNSILMTVLQ